MDGLATQVGGCVVDSGNFDWMANAEKFPGLCTPDESYHGLTYVKAFGKMGYTTKLIAQLMRDLGSIPAPQNSFLLNMGLAEHGTTDSASAYGSALQECTESCRIPERQREGGLGSLLRTAHRQILCSGTEVSS